MADDRVARQFGACKERNHGECGRSYYNDENVLIVCDCRCHAQVDAVIEALERRYAEGELFEGANES